MKQKLTYAKALEELELLSEEIESGHIDPDTLLDKIKRSMELVKYCREKLRDTDEKLQQIKNR